MIWMIYLRSKYFALFLVASWYSVLCEYHESIYWSPENPKFHFSQKHFQNNQAFLQKIVSPESNIIIICPNIATIASQTQNQPKRGSLYENIWIVNKDGFHSCKIDVKHKDYRLLHMCDKPDQLNYYNINFTQLFNSKENNPSSIYLLATSNGSKTSLNQTTGGHCMNTQAGFSLRIKFTLCKANSTDPICKGHISSSRNISNTTKTCKSDSTLNVKSSTTDMDSTYLLEVLAICLGVVLCLSLLLNIVFLIFMCLKRRRRRQGSTKKKSEEPMKSLIVEPHKSKHVKVSAAL